MKFNKQQAEDSPQLFVRGKTADYLAEVLEMLDKQYHTLGKPMLSDQSYDIIKDYFVEHFPKHPYIKKIGHKPQRTTTLPWYMPSLNKIKPNTPKSDAFFDKHGSGDYCVSEKIDGVSLLLAFNEAGVQLFTRGDGTSGQDVSHLACLLHIPKPSHLPLVVRAELVMDKQVFATTWHKEVNPNGYNNDRNMIAGLVSRTTGHPALRDVELVAHELVIPSGKKPSEQFRLLKSFGFKVPRFVVLSNPSDNQLSELLFSYKNKSSYHLDGLVVAADKPYQRVTDTNPSHAVAFKDGTQTEVHQAVVREVLWAVGKTGKLVPRLRIDPTSVGGVTVEFLTAFNAFFVEHGYRWPQRKLGLPERPLGPGAKIEFVRSGDVIPFVQKVIKGAPHPQLPNVPCSYSTNRIELYALDADDQITLKQITHFFTTVGADNLAEKLVEKAVTHGYDTVHKICAMEVADWQKLPGVQTTLATKLQNNVQQAVQAASLPMLGDASSCFGEGIGTRKLQLLFDAIPDVLTLPPDNSLYARMLTIDGFSDKTAKVVLRGLRPFKKFVQQLGKSTAYQPPAAVSNKLANVVVVFSQVRDKQLAELIKQHGGRIATSVSKATTHLLCPPNPTDSDKVQKARAFGVKISTIDHFRQEYQL